MAMPVYAAAIYLSVTPYVGITESNMDWNIASDLQGEFIPNVLSELTFQDMSAISYGLNFRASIPINQSNTSFVIEGDFLRSDLKKGTSRDSDYAEDNRASEFSRSLADLEGDGYSNNTLGLGISKKMAIFPKGAWFAEFSVGTKRIKNNLTMTNGRQIIADPGFFNGATVEEMTSSLSDLNATYSTSWDGVWIGLRSTHYFGKNSVVLGYQFNEIDFEGIGNWNLRDDLEHPQSFKQTGKGNGDVISLSYQRHFSRGMTVGFEFTQESWLVEQGVDETYFSGPGSTAVRLNEVNMDVSMYRVNLRKLF